MKRVHTLFVREAIAIDTTILVIDRFNIKDKFAGRGAPRGRNISNGRHRLLLRERAGYPTSLSAPITS